MRLTLRLFASSTAFALCAASCIAQSSVSTSAQSDLPPAAISESQTPAATAQAASQIRIVRLSQVHGQVQLDRNTGLRFEPAFPNLPIVAGEHLRTQDGVAEVEFEDNSSLRLTPNSQVDFPQLSRNSTGAAATSVTLVRGRMYVSLANSKTPADFTIRAGRETITMTPSSHLRLEINATTAKLTVLQGNVTAVGDAGSLLVSKHKAITFDLNAKDAPVFARLDEPTAFDAWDRNAVEYHKALAVAASYAVSPYSYGVNDLAYYGAFSDIGGCGSMWRPYFASASFDPYASGIWTWYPGSGYSWVSPYPWGWTPYHSGSWNYCGGGWGWQPQGNWNGIQNQPAILQKTKIPGPTRPHPPLPPVKGNPTIVAVNLNQLRVSKTGESDSFVFMQDSAGLGVPRGVFNNLGKISERAAERGFATRNVSENQASRGLIPTANATWTASSAHGATPPGSFSGSTSNRGIATASLATHTTSISSGGTQSFSAPSISSGSSSMASSASTSSGGAAHH
jgi:hypothetical protein